MGAVLQALRGWSAGALGVHASGPSRQDCRVEALELDAGIGGGEAPVDGGLGHVALVHPGSGFRDQRLSVRNARSRHCRLSTLSSVSARLSQLACLGV
jgi:hypothetical protein